ncbi:hypothetical protein HMPREF0758_4873 [Serratia odorifera DSM 4582]|uniref:Uncharacterized protein n=1 Tax=Serratia odorifera DSM 4582 TaxID=667129 RepID=D4E9M3_SEROD|nr:hypothetical protein HMPREF0758_4873 [Serratia odorifera DSM 4582]
MFKQAVQFIAAAAATPVLFAVRAKMMAAGALVMTAMMIFAVIGVAIATTTGAKTMKHNVYLMLSFRYIESGSIYLI